MAGLARAAMRPLVSLLAALAMLLGAIVPPVPASAALRSGPAWWDPDGIGTGYDWHYRVATSAGNAIINRTTAVDLDVAALLARLGVNGTFDPNSVRVVRPNGTLATEQEFAQTRWAASSNAVASRGQVRWITEDGGSQTTWIYFDILENGPKPPNPQLPINGNFEQSLPGTQLPAGWSSATRSNSAYDLEVRGSEFVTITSDGSPLHNPRLVDGRPSLGAMSYLLGARSADEPGTGTQADAAVLTRTIKVASSPGNLTVRWRSSGWDAQERDALTISLITASGSETVIVGNSLNNYTSYPNSPNMGGMQASSSTPGYGHYNGFDMTTAGVHTAAMTVNYNAERFYTINYPLAAFAGQTVTLKIAATQTPPYRSWFHIDEVEWSVSFGNLNAPQAFGAAVTGLPASWTHGERLRLRSTVDAAPTSPTAPLLADLVRPDGTIAQAGIVLYNDGAHDDGAAGDALWASAELALPAGSTPGSGWRVRAMARDASTSTLGTDYTGLAHREGQDNALVQTSWWNLGEASFAVQAAVALARTVLLLDDGASAAHPKAIPGARLRQCLTFTSASAGAATALRAADPLPAALRYAPGTLRSGASCASAATVEDDDDSGSDESDPTGASATPAAIIVTRPLLAPAETFAVTYEAVVE